MSVVSSSRNNKQKIFVYVFSHFGLVKNKTYNFRPHRFVCLCYWINELLKRDAVNNGPLQHFFFFLIFLIKAFLTFTYKIEIKTHTHTHTHTHTYIVQKKTNKKTKNKKQKQKQKNKKQKKKKKKNKAKQSYYSNKLLSM